MPLTTASRGRIPDDPRTRASLQTDCGWERKRKEPAPAIGSGLGAFGEDIVAICGTKRRTFLEENLEALNVELSPEDLGRIDEVAPRGIAVGSRYWVGEVSNGRSICRCGPAAFVRLAGDTALGFVWPANTDRSVGAILLRAHSPQ